MQWMARSDSDRSSFAHSQLRGEKDDLAERVSIPDVIDR